MRSLRRRDVSQRTELLVSTVAAVLESDDQVAADAALERLGRAIGADAAGLAVVVGDELLFRAGWNVREQARTRRMRAGEGVSGRVWATGRPRVIPDLAADPAHIPDVAGTSSGVYVPGFSQGRVLVVLGLESRRKRAYGERHVRLLSPVADLLAAAVDSEQRLRAAQQREDRLLTGVGTRLRGPLTTVVGNLRTLDQHGDRVAPEVSDELVAAANRAVVRIGRLLDALTITGRLGVGGVQPTIEPVRPADAVAPAVERVTAELRETHLDIDPSVAVAPAVLADADQLVVALAELVHNALVHGGGTATVVATAGDDGWGRIAVRDSGPGVAAGLLENALDLGVLERSPDGGGLGLALAARLVETMHGRLSVRSHPGRGTTAEISLPPAPR